MRRDGELPIGELLVAVEDEAVLGPQLGRGRLPLVRSGADEHRSRHRSGGAVAVELGPRAGRPAGHLHPERRVRVDRSGRRMLDADLRPVAVQLFGDEHGKARPDSLAHLGMREEHGDRIVRRHAHQPRAGGRHVESRDGRRISSILLRKPKLNIIVFIHRRVAKARDLIVTAHHQPQSRSNIRSINSQIRRPIAIDVYPQLRFIELQSRVRINDAADCFGFFPQRVRIFRQRLQLRSAKYEIDIKVAAPNIE